MMLTLALVQLKFEDEIHNICWPVYPAKPFGRLEEASAWIQVFVRWYNHEHKHSDLKFVTPAQRHTGQPDAILARRTQVYAVAISSNPRLWVGTTRNWKLQNEVWLNPIPIADFPPYVGFLHPSSKNFHFYTEIFTIMQIMVNLRGLASAGALLISRSQVSH